MFNEESRSEPPRQRDARRSLRGEDHPPARQAGRFYSLDATATALHGFLKSSWSGPQRRLDSLTSDAATKDISPSSNKTVRLLLARRALANGVGTSSSARISTTFFALPPDADDYVIVHAYFSRTPSFANAASSSCRKTTLTQIWNTGLTRTNSHPKKPTYLPVRS